MHKAKGEGALAALEEKLYLSLHDGIAAVSPEGTVLRHAHLDGALALCAGEKSLFCADHSGAIWRFDRETLMPRSLSCGGPGICAMCLSPRAERLYALLGEADSVLMSDARSGRPLAVNRCGCNPRALSLCGELLAVAGGESGCVHLYRADTLECLDEIGMPGPVYSALLLGGAMYALCLAPDLNALLVAKDAEKTVTLRLSGMPGCLCAAGDCIFAATKGRLHVLSRKALRLLRVRDAPGRAGRIFVSQAKMTLHDPLSECLFTSQDSKLWHRLFSGVNDACLL